MPVGSNLISGFLLVSCDHLPFSSYSYFNGLLFCYNCVNGLKAFLDQGKMKMCAYMFMYAHIVYGM